MILRIAAIAASLAALLGFARICQLDDESSLILLIVFLASPSIISLILAVICRRLASLGILTAISLLHGACFLLMIPVLSMEPGEHQSFLMGLITAVLYIFLFLPTALAMWITVAGLEIYGLLNKKKSVS